MNTKYACDGCTACCTSHGVQSIQKLPHSQCSFCTIGRGCSIYEKRPPECRSFECSWLLGKGGGIEHRPDKTGVVPVHDLIPDVGVVLVLTEYRDDALNSEFVFKWTRNHLFRRNYAVHFPIHGNVRLYLPRGAEEPTLKERKFLEEYWERKFDAIPFDSCLHGLVL